MRPMGWSEVPALAAGIVPVSKRRVEERHIGAVPVPAARQAVGQLSIAVDMERDAVLEQRVEWQLPYVRHIDWAHVRRGSAGSH